MNYLEAVTYLDGFVNFERTPPEKRRKGPFDLSRVRELANRLKNPQNEYPVLHVAGTKGKGSACAFLDSILRASGLRVGLYTSPHLIDLRERVRVDGEMISKEQFASHMKHCRPALEIMRNAPEGIRRPTYFEILTHLAFAHFASSKVDVAVIEVGMGGRLDATSICIPAVCGITHISLDHTAVLGDNLKLIAKEKAGILKPSVPAVVGYQHEETLDGIREIADGMDVPLEVLGRTFDVKIEQTADLSMSATSSGSRVRMVDAEGRDSYDATLGVKGDFQAENWAVATRMAQLFLEKRDGKPLQQSAVEVGSRTIDWPGRLQEIPQAKGEPRLFLDGAHNVHSLRVVLSELRKSMQVDAPLIAVFGCANDKDVKGMLPVLNEFTQGVVFTESGSDRACKAESLSKDWLALTKTEAFWQVEPVQAVDVALKMAGNDGDSEVGATAGVVVVIGSIYLVGAVLDTLKP